MSVGIGMAFLKWNGAYLAATTAAGNAKPGRHSHSVRFGPDAGLRSG